MGKEARRKAAATLANQAAAESEPVGVAAASESSGGHNKSRRKGLKKRKASKALIERQKILSLLPAKNSTPLAAAQPAQEQDKNDQVKKYLAPNVSAGSRAGGEISGMAARRLKELTRSKVPHKKGRTGSGHHARC